ncbi:hypothetical protein KGF54_004323 [Candida jiufengensis]|uniref:uncharacterized protein n=1 Tax=Candida jiufengensis TaxID=497108 RepID=UPI002224FE30|nr:uncharacterized protein KGF54_004323 [Candida jiufengensis]KAI5951249.1 hypothetical protein KGF54_004323 [Candida jiufengensis]
MFFYKLFHNDNSYSSSTFKFTIFESFYFPVLEEIILITILLIRIKKESNYQLNSQFDLCIITFTYITLSLKIYQYNISNYNDKYKIFLKYYNLWENQTTIQNQFDYDEEINANYIWNEISTYQPIDNEETTENNKSILSSSNNKPNTIEKSRSINCILPTEFSITKSERKLELKLSSHSLKHSSSRYLQSKTSKSSILDKLYSVSPGNTYHLDTAVAMAINAIEEEEEEQRQQFDHEHSFLNNDDEFLPDSVKVYENIDEEMEVSNKIDYVAGQLNHNTQYKYLATDNHFTNNDFTKTSKKSYEYKVLSFINWWAWLIPPLLPIEVHNNENLISNNFSTANERYPLLKTKLSNYNLNEPVTQSYTTTTTHRYIGKSLDFQIYVSYYYDIRFDSITNYINIDQWFLKYGQLLTKTNWVWILIDELNFIVWQFCKIEILGLILLSQNYKLLIFSLVLVLILKLFKLNYLHDFTNDFNFKLIITSEICNSTKYIFE